MTQNEALTLLALGHNAILTGEAGTGKTHVLRRYLAYLARHRVPHAVTASTGIAAVALGGQTLHAWSGIGVREVWGEKEFAELEKKKDVLARLRAVQVLVVDEVSMLHPRQLDMVDAILRRLRDFTKPFGGVQVVLAGDFFQLPPVTRAGEPPAYVFESAAFAKGEFLVCYLARQYRQEDAALLRLLRALRAGGEKEDLKAVLRTRFRAPLETDEPVVLYTHHAATEEKNAARLAALPGKARTFAARARGAPALVSFLKKTCPAPPLLSLKEGARVMCVKNDPRGRYVNGSLGVVEGFDPASGAPLVRLDEGALVWLAPEEWRIEAEDGAGTVYTQIPLRLAWAITVHKSQGMTLSALETDLSRAFAPGMGYVALSRARRLSSIRLVGGGVNDMALTTDARVRRFDAHLKRYAREAREALAALSHTARRRAMREVLRDRFGGTIPHDKDAPRAPRASPVRAEKKAPKKTSREKTAALLAEGRGVEEIAHVRSIAAATVRGHIDALRAEGRALSLAHLRPPSRVLREIHKAFRACGGTRLTPVYRALGEKYSYDTLWRARLFLEE